MSSNSFLTRRCAANQTALGNNTGLCAQCPDKIRGSRTVAEAAAMADIPYAPNNPNYNPLRWQRVAQPSNVNKIYCGQDPMIIKWTLYSECHGKSGTQIGFHNPFYYARVGTPSECFQNGKKIGNFLSARPAPVAAAPVVAAPAARRGRGRPARAAAPRLRSANRRRGG